MNKYRAAVTFIVDMEAFEPSDVEEILLDWFREGPLMGELELVDVKISDIYERTETG